MPIAAHPGLYDVDAPVPVLNGTRCSACGATSFPPLEIGCAECGSVALEVTRLAASGTLHSFATVRLHRGKDMETPFTVGEVVLDDGPMVRAVLNLIDGFAVGDRLTAEWAVVGVDESGTETVEPRFGRTS